MGAGGKERPIALVTGGHRRLGGVIAARLARAGYMLALHGSHDVELDPALAEMLAGSGTRWHGFIFDFADTAAPPALMSAVMTAFGRAPDLLVNSAASFGQDRLEDVTADDLAGHYAVNLIAPVLLTQAFVSSGARDGRDRAIINILDQRLDQPHGDQLAYTLSKQALAGFTRIAARTLAPHVRVNAVAPGLTIATSDYEPVQIERLRAMMPLARLPEAEEIAEAVAYLAQARAVTGQVLTVDGGAHMISFKRDFMHL